jgi:hypothetical protein
MMKRGLIAAVAVLASTPAIAEPAWDKVEFGMSVDQIHGLYPQDNERVIWKDKSVALKKWQVVEGCRGRVNIRFRDGKANTVEIDAPAGLDMSNAADCTGKIRNALIRKWGAPTSDHEKDTSSNFMGVKLDHREWSWATPTGVDIALKVDPGDEWHLIYKPGATGGI